MKSLLRYFSLFFLVSFSYSAIDWERCDKDDKLCNEEDHGLSLNNVLKVFRIIDLSLQEKFTEFELYNIPNLFNEQYSYDSSIFCKRCEQIFGRLQTADITTLTKVISHIGLFLCETFRIKPKQVCQGLLPPQINILMQKFQERLLDPKRVCPHMMMCKKETERISIKKTIDKILSDKPQKQRPIPTSANTFQLLQINDPHIDLKYEPGRNIYCDEIVCCRNNNNPKEKEKKFAPAGQWGSLSKCNLPIWTFEQMVKFIKNKLNVELGIWAGDNIGHNLWEQKPYDGLNLTLNLTQMLKQLDQVKFISMFGNHDSYPVNNFDFEGDTEKVFLNGLADAWQDWIGVEAANQFREKSYYSYYDYDFEVLVLVINTESCYNLNFYILDNPTDPNNQLSWLRDQLYQAEKNNQSVWIVGHIPPAGCLTRWARIYNAIINRFENVIRAQFSAHHHKDSFQVQLDEDQNPIGVVFIAPTAGIYDVEQNLQPSFRVYDIDLDTKIPVNFYQYRLNLTYWNYYPLADSIEWDLAYDMISEYQMQNLWDYNEFLKLGRKIKSDKDFSFKFTQNFFCGNMLGVTSKEKKIYCQTMSDPIKQLECSENLLSIFMQKFFDLLSGDWFTYKST